MKTIKELITELLLTVPFSPTRRKPCSTSSIASVMQPRTSAQHQPEEDWGVVPTPSTCGIQSSSHQHQWHQPKRSGTLHLSGKHHLQWCHNQQGPWQLLGKSQKILRKTVKEGMAESFALPLHKDPGIHSLPRSHPPVWCRDLGSLSEVNQATWAVSLMLLTLHFGIKWQDHVSNEEVLKRASLPSTESILLQVQLRWAGHVTTMEDVCMPKAVLFSELQEGKRDRGAPRKCYKTSWRHSSHRRETAISHGSRRPQTETVGTHQWGKPVKDSRHRGMKPQRKNTGGRKSQQHPNHPQPKALSVRSVAGCVHQESDSTRASYSWMMYGVSMIPTWEW